jgi:DNA invertase Pin-like site-specific DNA recombinase
VARKSKELALTAGIYVRISQDRAGDELGVARQRDDCTKLAEARGWTVGAVFSDDDISAFKGRRRPGYEQLLEQLKAGSIQAVVAWHPDRLHRSPIELERFIDIVESTGAAVATVQAGELDLSTAAGRMTARIVGAVARHESEHKSERLRRQREQQALQGRPHGGRRAFGYDRTGSKIIESEAELICEAHRRVVAGESLRAIATDWNARGMRSSSGRDWGIVSLRSMLTGPRLAGLRVHRGDVVGAGNWPAIFSREEHDEIRSVLGNPRVHRQGRPPISLLGGMITCGICGTTMHYSTRISGTRRYICGKTPGSSGCGRLAIQAERTEAIVVEVVLRRLDTPALARALDKPKNVKLGDVDALERRLAELADMFGAGDISRAEWIRARDGVEKRLAKARATRDATAGVTVLTDYREPGTLRAAWPEITVDQQRAILGAVVDRIVIAPAARPGKFDDTRISINWRD